METNLVTRSVNRLKKKSPATAEKFVLLETIIKLLKANLFEVNYMEPTLTTERMEFVDMMLRRYLLRVLMDDLSETRFPEWKPCLLPPVLVDQYSEESVAPVPLNDMKHMTPKHLARVLQPYTDENSDSSEGPHG